MVLVIVATLAAVVAASTAVAAATIVALTAPAAPTGAAGSAARPSVAVVMVASAGAADPPDGALLIPQNCCLREGRSLQQCILAVALRLCIFSMTRVWVVVQHSTRPTLCCSQKSKFGTIFGPY